MGETIVEKLNKRIVGKEVVLGIGEEIETVFDFDFEVVAAAVAETEPVLETSLMLVVAG